ncbi:MAG: hypothetical protein FWD18_07275 [Micrococcales bacterium]|nr:hypothetical protein [Micrococcales bacterium]
MQSKTPLPAPQQIREMLEMLLGRDVEMEIGADMPSRAADSRLVVGVFITEPIRNLAALWVSDLAISATIGAAIGLMPAGAAEEAAELGLTPMLADNVREAVNVTGSLLNAEGAPHVILDEVYLPGERLPKDVDPMVSAYVPRHNLKIKIPGYPEGILSIAVP